MRTSKRHDAFARLLLTLGALLPYLPLLTLNTVYVTDDFFASDIFHGELPGRVLGAQLSSKGGVPLWTDQLCSGLPLGLSEPIGLSAFALLPTATALDVFLIIMLLVAAHGTYSFARRLGAARAGSVLAGIAFAGSGYLACQLKHLTIVSTVVWLPVGMLLLDGALSERRAAPMVAEDEEAVEAAPPAPWQRVLRLALFGLVLAEQALSGFPQSVYICGLVYGSWAVFRVTTLRGRHRGIPRWLLWLSVAGVVTALGLFAGAAVLLPLLETGKLSYRGEGVGYSWSVAAPYWPRNALTFLLPYVNGDISDASYTGNSFFWEDYGYVGAATFLLALYALAREWRRPQVVFLGVTAIVAYLIVLGPATPVFPVAWKLLPGLKTFRWPTRFLVIVDFGLCVLAAHGLTRFGEDLKRWLRTQAPRAPRWLVATVCAATALDLFLHQPRQNPMVPAGDWLAPPRMVELLRKEPGEVRTLTLDHRSLHRRVFELARGWADVTPYYLFRESLQPNTGVYWGVAASDCYAGIAPLWVTDTWGDHSTPGVFLSRAKRPPTQGPLRSGLPAALGVLGVSHLITPLELALDGLTFVGTADPMNLYRVEGASTARFVARARPVATNDEAAIRMLAPSFVPHGELFLHDAPPGFEIAEPGEGAIPAVEVKVDTKRPSPELVVVELDAPAPGGYLFLADTYYPGWKAELDGKEVPIARANIMGRAVRVPSGAHRVTFSYRPKTVWRGVWISAGCLSVLVAAAVLAGLRERRGRGAASR